MDDEPLNSDKTESKSCIFFFFLSMGREENNSKFTGNKKILKTNLSVFFCSSKHF